MSCDDDGQSNLPKRDIVPMDAYAEPNVSIIKSIYTGYSTKSDKYRSDTTMIALYIDSHIYWSRRMNTSISHSCTGRVLPFSCHIILCLQGKYHCHVRGRARRTSVYHSFDRIIDSIRNDHTTHQIESKLAS